MFLGTAAYKYRTHVLSQDADVDPLAYVYQRSADWLAKVPQTCSTCSVVIPSNTYAGRGFGPLIDSADCVVRFNAHDPNSTDAIGPEDYGQKDDIRFINGNPDTGWKVWEEPCFNGGCRRTFVTWSTGDAISQWFLGEQEGTSGQAKKKTK